MEILVFKTSIQSRQDILQVQNRLDKDPFIDSWSVDIEDIDNVLRIETKKGLAENAVIQMITHKGFDCQTL